MLATKKDGIGTPRVCANHCLLAMRLKNLYKQNLALLRVKKVLLI